MERVIRVKSPESKLKEAEKILRLVDRYCDSVMRVSFLFPTENKKTSIERLKDRITKYFGDTNE